MAIIGFIVCLLFMIWMTFAWIVIAVWWGHTNSNSETLGMTMGAIVIGWLWYLMFAYAPFSVVAN